MCAQPVCKVLFTLLDEIEYVNEYKIRDYIKTYFIAIQLIEINRIKMIILVLS